MLVLDASALLALIFKEEGHDRVAAVVSHEGACMSVANISEVAARLNMDGWTPTDYSSVIESFKLEMINVDWNLAMLAGQYRATTKHLGLGLGDRLCLATAALHELPALTADQAWRNLDIPGLVLEFIR